uniref:Uncharacterized protein n=1 Tax=Anguilla anguilla TaxID=7936 RepID=A0A0E9WHF3_ANGAN
MLHSGMNTLMLIWSQQKCIGNVCKLRLQCFIVSYHTPVNSTCC